MSELESRQIEKRQSLMRACSHATLDELTKAIAHCEPFEVAKDVRAPEVGLVMVRGRTGGNGAPFNVGEATVTRAVVQIGQGAIGYSYLLGRAKARARQAAVVDALGHDPKHRAVLEDTLIGPVTRRVAEERETERAKVAATRVNFFTMVRGEDGA